MLIRPSQLAREAKGASWGPRRLWGVAVGGKASEMGSGRDRAERAISTFLRLPGTNRRQRHQFNVALKGGDGPTEEVTAVRAGPRGPD